MSFSRRQFLEAMGALLLSGCGRTRVDVWRPYGWEPDGTVPFVERRNPPPGVLLDQGLDGRLYTDLSELQPDDLVVPTPRFYIRTAASSLLKTADWVIGVHGRIQQERRLTLATLLSRARSLGPCLLECSGNTADNGARMMSCATWSGVPLADLLEEMPLHPSATRVLVSGFDAYPTASRTSRPGASWIFTFDDVRRSGAFLATAMNGQDLTLDHGYPVRLVVPRWYGCASIKWVNEIKLVGEDEPSTDHMREFASRTHQKERCLLARDYTPAVVDTAAMPVRVERWRNRGTVIYRVVGILWGGERPTDKLVIRFNQEPPQPLEHCPMPASSTAWSMWFHTWRPRHPGLYRIRLACSDASIRTRRLDIGYYTRAVRII